MIIQLTNYISDPKAYDSEAPYLTIYEMPDVQYRETAEFKGLDGQSEPEQELLESVFKRARFDTRFYECVQEFGKGVESGGFLPSYSSSPFSSVLLFSPLKPHIWEI